MTQMNKVIEIVKYHEGLAAGIAKMWNLSRDSWGGDTRVKTEEQVKTTEANSDNIELYLALDGEEVVGYCGLSEYKEDTGSLYIPLLNVRPDYHGHKIGKKLVLKALEKTVDLGWPRLDLYTWPGNTKAVPLYKKCGFFWEDRDDSTHLMNFIPQVLNTPLLKPVFEKLDWYDSSVRQIEVKPDGTKVNGFSFYEYSWQSEGKAARVHFERTSRGISLVETDDFLLQIMMDDHEVIEQQEQKFQIRIVNKSSAPLSFKAKGNGTNRILYMLNTEMTVRDEVIISEVFTVKNGEEPSIWRTHPSICATVWINGQECELKLGVFPLQPAKIEATYSGNLSFLNQSSSFDLEVKNNLGTDADFSLRFPDDDLVVLENHTVTVHVPSRGRNSVPVPFTLKRHGFYKPEIVVTAKQSDGTELKYEQDISVAFKGLGEKFYGESTDFWHIYNGLGQVNVRKRDLLTTAARNEKRQQSLAFFAPKLGKPYSLEFTKKKPSSVTSETDGTSIDLKITLESSEMKGIHLTQTIQLFGDGIIHRWAEIENNGTITHSDVAFTQPVYHELGRTYFPLDQKVVYFSENRLLEYGDIKPSSITGNWYFTESKGEPIGLAWSANSNAAPEGWQFLIEDSIGTMEPGATHSTGKITLAIGAFQHFEEFRAYAEQTPIIKKSELTRELDLELDRLIIDHNEDPSVTLKTYRNSYLNGTLNLAVDNQELSYHSIAPDEEKTTHSLPIEPGELEPISILSAKFIENGMETTFSDMILAPSGKKNASISEDGAIIVDNGCITLKADPDFYPGVYSIKVNGHEWLDHSYPELTAKSWWNPWAGGMKTAPSGINTFSLLKEKTSASEVQLIDRDGNKWSGLALTTEFTEHKQWKGIHYVQYYLMLPGVPVVASFVEVTNNGGKVLQKEAWVTDLFINGEKLSDLNINVNDRQQTNSYRAGVQEIPLILDEDSYISSKHRPEKLYLIQNLHAGPTEGYTNKEVFQLVSNQTGIPEERGKKTAPLFLLFDERELSAHLVKKLRRIQY